MKDSHLRITIAGAEKSVRTALMHEETAVASYARAYSFGLLRDQEDNRVLFTTEDGWDQGPLPFALEIEILPEGDLACDPDAVFLYRDGGPTCSPFWLDEAVKAVRDESTIEIGALRFVRQLTYPSGKIAFLDGHQAAGLLLAVLEMEGL